MRDVGRFLIGCFAGAALFIGCGDTTDPVTECGDGQVLIDGACVDENPDAGTTDTVETDAGTSDAGTEDTGTEDTGTEDTGPEDAGTEDTSVEDTAGPAGPEALPFAVDDFYFATGYMGDGEVEGAIVESECPARAAEGAAGACHVFTYEAPEESKGWGGVLWQYPADNWGDGDVEGLALPVGAKRVEFWAWGPVGGETADFIVGIEGVDGFKAEKKALKLTAEPTKYWISLEGVEYGTVVSAFGFALQAPAEGPVAIHIDGIVWTDADLEGVPGCTDDGATNWNEEATIDDGSCTYNVTFAVDTTLLDLGAEDVVNVNGTFNEWCGGCAPMADEDGDGVWTLVIPLANGAYEFKYTINGWDAQETVPAECDVVQNGENFNRGVTVDGAAIELDVVDYGYCSDVETVLGCTDPNATNQNVDANKDDGSCLYLYPVTFNVDMSDAGLVDGDIVHLNGTFNEWCGDCAPMADEDGDGIYSLTIDLAPGDYQHKFSVNGWDKPETVPAECDVVKNGENFNRGFTVLSAALDLTAHKFSECPTLNVSLSVDMSDVELKEGDVVYVNGTWNGWCGNCNPLADEDGDGVWSVTLPLPSNTHEYKFTINGWEAQEDVPAECALSPDGPNFNRWFFLYSVDITAPVTKYGACPVDPNAAVKGCMDEGAQNFNAEATEDDGSCEYLVTFHVDMSAETLNDGDVVSVEGTWNSWCGGCNALTDQEDGTWLTTLPLKSGTYEYKYTIGGWEGTVEPVPAECDVVADPNFDNRGFTVEGADLLITPHAFGKCAE